MPKIDQDTKQKRKDLVYDCVLRHDAGITEKEIDELLALGRRNVNNYLRELEVEGKVEKQGHLWVGYPYRRTTLRRFEISPEEAMTLYLATRLLVKQHDKRNESAQTALVKLAEVLTGDVGVGDEIHQAALELAHRPGDESYSRIFRTVMQGYIYRHKLAITYEPLGGTAFDTVLEPYLLEPSAIGYATYIIGRSSVVNALRTYKLERIRAARLTRDEYTVPADFPGLEYLRSAWSIISGEETTRVVVRFAPGVAAQRVRESYWHPSQQIMDDPEHPGGCLWSAQVADVLDFKPWLRSWGGDVEVLEPPALREEMQREVRKMALLYQVGNVAPPPVYQLLWAKLSRDKTRSHPLICHLLDVAAVAQVLWDKVLTDGIRSQMAVALGLDIPQAGRTITFLAGSHDLGKASPCFQCRNERTWRQLQKETQLPFGGCSSKDTCYHGTITTATLARWLEHNFGFSRDWAQWTATTVGGHHGHWPTASELEVYAPPGKCGQGKWEEIRHDLLRTLEMLIKPVLPRPPQLSPSERNAFFALLGGLTTVADWLGSNENYFTFVDADIDVKEYFAESIKKAYHALNETGWLGWQPPAQAIDFQMLCGVSELRPLQEAVVHLAPQLLGPGLVIMEAPTGVGKTEAALYLSDYWMYTLQQRGTYVAMPTMATSNLMFERVKKILKRRYPDSILNFHLLHGNALLLNSDTLPQLTKIGACEEKQGTVAALSWFTKAKRGLLAPFAVGTVDQALLSILQTPHFFVRLLGLSHKTVIFDEIHAYDTYMEELFFLLLRWLRVINASVIILSATLPQATRRKLVAAYTGIDEKDIAFPAEARYPMITWTTGKQPQIVNLPSGDDHTIALETITRQPAAIAERLAILLHDGGCAAVLCNTVERAREVFEVLSADSRLKSLIAEEDFILFHARFPLAWRLEIENLVRNRFGKPDHEDEARQPRRPAIVVATQVIEQSLDLDFDLMVSDLAPIDLIIQRAGRLHRHTERDALRPKPLHQARLLLAMPDLDADGLPDLPRGDQWIYGKYWLLRSYLALRHLPELVTPRDTSALIESVYDLNAVLPDADSAPFIDALQSAWTKSKADRQKAQSEANRNLIVSPTAIDFLEHPNADLEEDNPDLHRYRQAATRLSPPSVTLICLHRAPDGQLLVDPELNSLAVSIETEPDQAMVRELVNRKVEVSNHDLVDYFVSREVPISWRNNAWLRHARLVVFQGGVCEFENMPFTLKIDRKLGLYMEDKL